MSSLSKVETVEIKSVCSHISGAYGARTCTTVDLYNCRNRATIAQWKSRGRAAPVQAADEDEDGAAGSRATAGLPCVSGCMRRVADKEDDSEASKRCCMTCVQTS